MTEPLRQAWPGDPEDVNEARHRREMEEHAAVLERRDAPQPEPVKE